MGGGGGGGGWGGGGEDRWSGKVHALYTNLFVLLCPQLKQRHYYIHVNGAGDVIHACFLLF